MADAGTFDFASGGELGAWPPQGNESGGFDYPSGGELGPFYSEGAAPAAPLTLSASGSSTSSGSAAAIITFVLAASGASTSSGSAILTLITAAQVTQSGLQADAEAEERHVTQSGLQADAEAEERHVTQANLQVDAEAEERHVTQANLQVDAEAEERRVTFAGLQVDARRRRVANNTDCWELHITDRAGTHLGVLDNVDSPSFQAVLSDSGSGRFRIPLDDADASLLQAWRRVIFRYRDVDVFAMVIEAMDRELVSEKEKPGQFITVTGRGLLGTLEKGLVWPGNIADPSTVQRTWSAVPLAEIFLDLYNEFVTRGGGDLTPDFTDTLDSDSASWTDSQTLQFKAGTNLLQVLRQLAGFGFDATVDPDGTMHAYKSAGSDLSSTVIFRHGQNVRSVGFNTRIGDQATAVLGEGQGVLAEGTDASAITAWGRREGYLPIHNTDQSGQVTSGNSIYLTNNASPVDSYTLSVRTADNLRPFIDYNLGDTIHLSVPGHVDSDFRIIGIAMSERSGPCDLDVVLSINSVELEYMIKLDQAFRASAGSVPPGSASSGLPIGDPRVQSVSGHTHTESDITDLDHDADKIEGKDVDPAAIADGRVLVYRSGSDTLVYEDQSGAGGDALTEEDLWVRQVHKG